jgi:hypothetical protein
MSDIRENLVKLDGPADSPESGVPVKVNKVLGKFPVINFQNSRSRTDGKNCVITYHFLRTVVDIMRGHVYE